MADLVCTNVHSGVFAPAHAEDRAYHVADMGRLVCTPTAEHLRQARADFSDKPILVTEFGARSIPGMRGDSPYSEDRHVAYLEAVWRGVRGVSDVVGGVVWSWANYYHQREVVGATSPAPSVPFGVVTVDRKPKQPLYALAHTFGGEAQRCCQAGDRFDLKTRSLNDGVDLFA